MLEIKPVEPQTQAHRELLEVATRLEQTRYVQAREEHIQESILLEAFGVLPEFRRQQIGQRMQEEAIAICGSKGCYQMRSRSPITSQENYALKLKMGYAIHPSEQNDSYYFIKLLKR